MELFKTFSLNVWIKQFGQSCRRFPVSVLLLIMLAVFMIALIHGTDVSDKWEFFFIFYPATGALLGVSLQLLTEDFKHRLTAFLTQVLVHAVWLGISLYLAQFDHFSLPQYIAVAATVVTMVLSVFLLCFYRKSDDVPFWNFSMRMLVNIAVSMCISGFLYLGIILLLQSFNWLLGVKVPDEAFPDAATVCMMWLAPMLLLNLIPQGSDKRLHQVMVLSGFFKGVVLYLFIPLLCLYMITLIIYATKILVTWQLPIGWVSYLVSASMMGMVVLLYFTYPVQHEPGKSVLKSIMRWMPLVMLPLLALMTVAIGRRLSDYGITVSRLYLAVFNLWCYAVCIGLLITRNKRIWWIPASFAVILFLISVGPQSIANITRRQLLGEARQAFTASGIRQFPLTGEQYEQWLKTADQQVARSIDAKLDYLYSDYGFNAVSTLLAKDAITGRRSTFNEKGDIVYTHYDSYINDGLIQNVPVPQGYAAMTMVSVSDNDIVKINGDKLQFSVKGGKDEEHLFEIDLKLLARYDNDRNPDGCDEPLVIDNGEALMLINEFNVSMVGTSANYLSFSGILFTR